MVAASLRWVGGSFGVHRPTQPGWRVTLGANWPTQFGPATTPEAGEGDSGVVARLDVDAVPGGAGQGDALLLHPWSRHDGRVPEVDDDQLAALAGCRVASGLIEVVEVVCHYPVVSDDPEDDQGGGTGELGERRGWRTRGG